MKAYGTDTSGYPELLGKCHDKRTTNASDSANYPVGTNMFPFTVLYLPVWVQEKQFLMHPGIELIVKQSVKLHFAAKGPGCTKPLSKEVVQGKTVRPEKGQATQQPWCRLQDYSFQIV